MQYFEEFKIGTEPLLLPDGDVELTLTDLDAGSAGRDESGVMHRIRVRKRVKSWSFRYSTLRREEFHYLENLLSRESAFDFTYLDSDGVVKTCRAYCAKTGLTYENARLGLYRNYKFQIIEC